MSDFEVITDGANIIKAWIKGVPLEQSAREQLVNTSNLPFIFKHISVMPDVHYGIGATVGSVIPTKGAIIPAAVGVDIGCGMVAAKTNMTSQRLPESLKELRHIIEKAIPVGFADYGDNIPSISDKTWDKIRHEYSEIQEKHKGTATRKSPLLQLGTLGGGNHFIEFCLDEEDNVWIMLHSGSRGVGNRIGTYFISKAKEEMERHFIHLPDKNLAYLPEGSELFDDYIQGIHWAQEYARLNRDIMLECIIKISKQILGDFELQENAVNCHHNYVARENHFGSNIWVTRKGAVRAREGDLGIIPGSMGARSYIVRGKGNLNSFQSCSHGAGRVMSRSEAKKVFSKADHAKATEGVECRKDEGVIDETPGAYKDIDAVMAAQSDLVDIVATLKQILCVKG